MMSWRTLTAFDVRGALAAMVLCSAVGCDVYNSSFLDSGPRDSNVMRDLGGFDSSFDAASFDAGDCPRGFADCDSDGSCETDLNDRLTCGFCARMCGPSQSCMDMDCVDPPDAGVDSGTDSGTDMGVDADMPACPLTHPPERPDIATEGPDGTRMVFALKDPVFDQRGGRWSEMAHDLDDHCTNDAAADDIPCVPPTGGSVVLDGPGGVDNAMGERLFSLLVMFNPAFEGNVQANMNSGQTIVVRIDGWNGEDDDPRVDAVIAQAVDFERPDSAPTPQWDGSDRWTLSTTSFRDGDADVPLIRDDNAYIAGRRLVARIPDRQALTMPWADGAPFELYLTDARVTGTISADGSRLENAWVTGRYAFIDFAPVLDAISICPGSIRPFVEAELQEDLDVRATPGTGGPGVFCDAISLGIEFTGFRSDWGGLQAPPVIPPSACSCITADQCAPGKSCVGGFCTD